MARKRSLDAMPSDADGSNFGTVRAIAEAEEARFLAAVRHGYHQPPPTPPEIERARFGFGYMGHRRTRVVEDQDRFVATGAIWPFRLSVPGGEVQCAGVTWIATHPTHRRRGLLRRVMGELHSQAQSDGDAIAALWSLESGIYSRFGYGIASVFRTMRVDPSRIRFRDDIPVPDRVREVDRDEALRIFPSLAGDVAHHRPGTFSRDFDWWEQRSLPIDEAARLVVSEQSDGPTGFAVFTPTFGLDDHLPAGEIAVKEVVASSPGAWAGLWHHLCNHDLIAQLEYTFMPEDDPLPLLVTEPRLLRHRPVDGLWVRILDIESALAARRYSDRLSVDFEITDVDHDGPPRWHLETDGTVTECHPTEGPPQIRLALEDLGAAYLGRSHLAASARAGRVTGEIEILRAADRAFTWDPPPHCPEIF